jgi:hypothetical protein
MSYLLGQYGKRVNNMPLVVKFKDPNTPPSCDVNGDFLQSFYSSISAVPVTCASYDVSFAYNTCNDTHVIAYQCDDSSCTQGCTEMDSFALDVCPAFGGAATFNRVICVTPIAPPAAPPVAAPPVAAPVATPQLPPSLLPSPLLYWLQALPLPLRHQAHPLPPRPLPPLCGSLCLGRPFRCPQSCHAYHKDPKHV